MTQAAETMQFFANTIWNYYKVNYLASKLLWPWNTQWGPGTNPLNLFTLANMGESRKQQDLRILKVAHVKKIGKHSCSFFLVSENNSIK